LWEGGDFGHGNAFEVEPATKIGLYQHADTTGFTVDFNDSRRCSNPSFETKGAHTGAPANGSFRNWAARCVFNARNCVFRTNVKATNVVEVCIGCLTNHRIKPRDFALALKMVFNHISHDALVGGTHTEGVGKQDRGVYLCIFIDQRETGRSARTVKGVLPGFKGAFIPVAIRWHDCGDPCAHGAFANDSGPISLDQRNVANFYAGDIRYAVKFAGTIITYNDTSFPCPGPGIRFLFS